MIESQYLVIYATGLITMLVAIAGAEYHEESDVLAAVATVAFAVLALQGGSIEVVLESGGTEIVGGGVAQLFTLVLALVNGVITVAAFFGYWPVEPDDGHDEDTFAGLTKKADKAMGGRP